MQVERWKHSEVLIGTLRGSWDTQTLPAVIKFNRTFCKGGGDTKGSFTPSDSITVTVTNVMLTGNMGMQPILPKGSFTPSDSITVTVTNVMLTGNMGMQPILPITVPIKKIKGAARQRYGDGDVVAWCERALNIDPMPAHSQEQPCETFTFN